VDALLVRAGFRVRARWVDTADRFLLSSADCS
jgi:hypothetical protein